MDEILAYMYLLIKKAKEKKVSCKKEEIKTHGGSVQYFSGVEDYFARINKHAKDKEISLKHYIISSGTKEMIEVTSIALKIVALSISSKKWALLSLSLLH
jgi:hypothetical protein